MRSLTTSAVVLAAWLASAASAHARTDQPPSPAGVSLESVVRAALSSNTDVRLARTAVDQADADVLLAREPFDSALAITGNGSQSYQFSPTGSGQPLALQALQLGLSFSQRFRTGIVLAPEVTTTRNHIGVPARLDYTDAAAHLKLLVPLLRDFRGTLTREPERQALAGQEAARLDQRQADANGVFQATRAYWTYLTTRRKVEVLGASEERARRIAAETGALVQAENRTRADLIQAQGNQSNRRASRVQAELQQMTAWQELELVTGLNRDDLTVLPEVATDFPAVVPGPSLDSPDRWLALAAAQRPDLAAARRREDAALDQVRAARDELRPRVDLLASVGYVTEHPGTSFGNLGLSLYRDLPGVDASLQIRVELPIQRSGPRGRVAESLAGLERERLVRLDLDRRIRVETAGAVSGIKRARQELEAADEAVRNLQQTVDNERRKFQLGVSTLFTVIQAEDALTNALLAKLDGQSAVAFALTALWYHTAALVPRPGEVPPDAVAALVAARLTTLP